jgi:hypothetical protein
MAKSKTQPPLDPYSPEVIECVFFNVRCTSMSDASSVSAISAAVR